MNIRRSALFLLSLIAFGTVAWFVGCSPAPDPWSGKPTPHILVSVPPLYSFAKSVAGEHGEVLCLCKKEGPHHYEYSSTDLRTLRGATRFFSVGLTLDDKFCDAMMKATGTNEDVHVELGDKLTDKLTLRKEGAEHHDAKDEHGHEHHANFDPHVWLGTPQAIEMVEQIRDELKKVDPANAADYDKNAAAYIKELKKLHDDGLALLKDKKNKKIVSFHESLGYFAKEFGIEIVDVIEDFPGIESDVKKINKLIRECKDNDVRVIAVEPQYPTTTAASTLLSRLKDEGKVDVKLVEIDPLETVKTEPSADLYLKTMRENLKQLADNLP
jgi:ABC-type Zn uptake system ZnuABC Zn-binding protein ZnuA